MVLSTISLLELPRTPFSELNLEWVYDADQKGRFDYKGVDDGIRTILKNCHIYRELLLLPDIYRRW